MFFLSKKTFLKDIVPATHVDIHSHILPGIDDGAKDMKTSMLLLQKFSDFGIHNLVTTPHIKSTIFPNTPDLILKSLDNVQQELKLHNLEHMNIRAAAEYFLNDVFLEKLEQGEPLLCLTEDVVLVEFSHHQLPMNAYDLLFQLQLKSYTPVLAHPERYRDLQTQMHVYMKLKDAGCLFQLNLLSLTDFYGKSVQKTAYKLLGEGYYDCFGSDVHHAYQIEVLSNLKISKHLPQFLSLVNSHQELFKGEHCFKIPK